MPVVPTTAYAPSEDALNLARSLVNDSAGAVFTDALLMPFLNSAYRGLHNTREPETGRFCRIEAGRGGRLPSSAGGRRDHDRRSPSPYGVQEAGQRRVRFEQSVRRNVESRRCGDLIGTRPHDLRRNRAALAGEAEQVRSKLGDLMYFDDNSLSIGGRPSSNSNA